MAKKSSFFYLVCTLLLGGMGVSSKVFASGGKKNFNCVHLANSEEEIRTAMHFGKQATLEKIADGKLSVDTNGNLKVTQRWIDRMKENLTEEYEIITAGPTIILENKKEAEIYGNIGITKIVNRWKGFDLYLSNLTVQNVGESQRLARVVTLIVRGESETTLSEILTASFIVFEKINEGNGVVIFFVGSLNVSGLPLVTHWVAAQ